MSATTSTTRPPFRRPIAFPSGTGLSDVRPALGSRRPPMHPVRCGLLSPEPRPFSQQLVLLVRRTSSQQLLLRSSSFLRSALLRSSSFLRSGCFLQSRDLLRSSLFLRVELVGRYSSRYFFPGSYLPRSRPCRFRICPGRSFSVETVAGALAANLLCQ